MSLVKLKLKPPVENQLSQVVEIDQLSLGGLWTLEGYQRELQSPNSGLFVLSIDIPLRQEDTLDIPSNPPMREQIIGCGCFWAILEEAHITLLAIHPDYQGKGLGKLLLYALIRDAVHRKLERATLEVKASNQVALSLYQKFGFKIAGRRKGYYQQTGEDALVLWRGDLHDPNFEQQLQVWHQEITNRLSEFGFTLDSPL